MTAVDVLGAGIPAPWRGHLSAAVANPTFAELAAFLEGERERTTVYPPPELMFNALAMTPPGAVRAVILGQDPYHGPGQAHGLAFSVPEAIKPPPSLRNILKEVPSHGAGHSLEPWARRGVLLLNTVLTVEEGRPGSHRGRGWEPFTDAIIEAVMARPRPIVFLLWGKQAQCKARLIDSDRHIVLEAGHPSPRSYRYFKGRAGFIGANDALRERGRPLIDWSL